MASIAMSTTTEEGGASGLSWTWRLFSCSGSKTSCQASSPSSGRQATTESPAEAPCSPEETSSSLTESAELESWGTSSPKSPLDVNFGRRRKGTYEHGKERSLSRREDDDVQWLKAESNKTLAMLELAAHGTIDLTLDVPEIRDEPEFTCERFLRGFQYNRAKSLKNLEGYVMWRSNTSKVEEADIKESLRARKVFLLQDRDRRGGPVCVILARNHDRFRTTVEETVKLLTYSLDRTIGTMDPSLGATQATVLLDLDGLGWRSLDVEALKHIMLFFQNYFPERVSTAVFWKAPRVFGTIWALVRPFLSEATRSKILFASTTQELGTIVEEANLPGMFGGAAGNNTMVAIDSSAIDEKDLLGGWRSVVAGEE